MEERRVLICGDRDWTDERKIYKWLRMLKRSGYTHIIEGEARGADSIARDAAVELGLDVLGFKAKWDEFGKSAGPKRNVQMLVEGAPELVVAFHDNIKASKGTKHMVKIASEANIPTIVVRGIDP